ncbi:MAG: hypothetical protein RRY34_05110, partial [Victivallaceae bacterium]
MKFYFYFAVPIILGLIAAFIYFNGTNDESKIENLIKRALVITEKKGDEGKLTEQSRLPAYLKILTPDATFSGDNLFTYSNGKEMAQAATVIISQMQAVKLEIRDLKILINPDDKNKAVAFFDAKAVFTPKNDSPVTFVRRMKWFFVKV